MQQTDFSSEDAEFFYGGSGSFFKKIVTNSWATKYNWVISDVLDYRNEKSKTAKTALWLMY